jgi:hypothetical protein
VFWGLHEKNHLVVMNMPNTKKMLIRIVIRRLNETILMLHRPK